MADTSRQADALLTDHFTYTPLSLIDDIINAVNTIIYQALDAIEDGLLNVPPAQLGFKQNAPDDPEPSDAARHEIEEGVHQLETLLESTVDKSFDKFEIYTLRNILTVPEDLSKWIRLKHYEGLQLSTDDSSVTPESIQARRKQIHETTKLNLALKAKQAQNAALINQLRSITSPAPQNTVNPSEPSDSLAYLTQSSTKPAQNPISTQTQFAASQLPALQQLVQELRPQLDKLRRLDPADLPRDAKREERRQYIDGGARRIVAKGSLPAGEGDLRAMDGERRSREEVEMLEGMLRGVQGEKQG